MDRKAGVWIDHNQAIIVFLAGEKEEVRRIESNVERHVRQSGGSRSKTPYGPQDVMAEDHRERKFAGHLKQYYEEVAAAIREADSIFIFGPGEAKAEMKKHLEAHHLGDRIVGVEAVDKMTDRQIEAKVRDQFKK